MEELGGQVEELSEELGGQLLKHSISQGDAGQTSSLVELQGLGLL